MEEIWEEVHCLQAIYDDLVVTTEEEEEGRGGNEGNGLLRISLAIRPSVASADSAAHAVEHVAARLELAVAPPYPHALPETIALGAARGLDDAQCDVVRRRMIDRGTQLLGTPMLYDLIEVAKGWITSHNRPFSCPVCLESLDHAEDMEVIPMTVEAFVLRETPKKSRAKENRDAEGIVRRMSNFVGLGCHHCFHLTCLAGAAKACVKSAVEHAEQKILLNRTLEDRLLSVEALSAAVVCPVCRERLSPTDVETIAVDIIAPQNLSANDADDEEFVLPPSVRALQEQMQEMFLSQKKNGGIIDVEENRRKLLVDETTLIDAPSSSPSSSSSSPDKKEDKISAESSSSPSSASSSSPSSSSPSPSSSSPSGAESGPAQHRHRYHQYYHYQHPHHQHQHARHSPHQQHQNKLQQQQHHDMTANMT